MEYGKVDGNYGHYASEVFEDTSEEMEQFYARVNAWARREGVVLGESRVAIEENGGIVFPLTYVIRTDVIHAPSADIRWNATREEADAFLREI